MFSVSLFLMGVGASQWVLHRVQENYPQSVKFKVGITSSFSSDSSDDGFKRPPHTTLYISGVFFFQYPYGKYPLTHPLVDVTIDQQLMEIYCNGNLSSLPQHTWIHVDLYDNSVILEHPLLSYNFINPGELGSSSSTSVVYTTLSSTDSVLGEGDGVGISLSDKPALAIVLVCIVMLANLSLLLFIQRYCNRKRYTEENTAGNPEACEKNEEDSSQELFYTDEDL